MTNDQLEQSALNLILFPAAVFFICVGLFLTYDFWRREIVSRELASFAEVVADDYTLKRDMRETTITYSYTVDGTTYRSDTFSPYSDLSRLAERSTQVRALTTRSDNYDLTVFFDPEDPARSSILRAWPREGRLGGLALGGITIWLGCLTIFRMAGKVPRYDLLFRGMP